MGTELQPCKMKKMEDLLHNTVNIFNTLVHLKIMKMVASRLCDFDHN